LLTWLTWMQGHAPPEQVMNMAALVEILLASLGRPYALAQAAAVREQAAQMLTAWSQARFLAEKHHIERLRQSGDIIAPHPPAQHAPRRPLEVGEVAYPGAAYDIASAYWMVGTGLLLRGADAEALQPLTEAHRRFQSLGDTGHAGAERMTAAVVSTLGDCL